MTPKTRTKKPRRKVKDKAWEKACQSQELSGDKVEEQCWDTEIRQRERQSVLWRPMRHPLSGPQIRMTTKKLFFSFPSKDGLHITLREVNM